MNANKGLTKVDAIIVVACIALVLAQASIINAGGRERSKREVCLANLRMLAAAWQIYSNDNKGKIPVGDVGYSWTFPTSAGGPQPAWVEWPRSGAIFILNPTEGNWKHSIPQGTLWKYVGDYNIYRCSSSTKIQYVTYAMSMSMNTYPGASGTGAVTFTNINQITKPAERLVFLDKGYASQGAFYINYNSSGGSAPPGTWGDHPPMIHSQGTNFVFADGHAIYRKWTDPHALAAVPGQWGGGPVDYCDCDLRWMQKVTWGSVPYTCSDPAKNCEY